jgi:hypothetical protein
VPIERILVEIGSRRTSEFELIETRHLYRPRESCRFRAVVSAATAGAREGHTYARPRGTM